MARKINKTQQKRIVRASRKAASRAGVNDRASVRKIRVQVVPLWKRWFIVGLGLLILGAAIYSYQHSLAGAIVLAIISLIVILLGAFGRKKSIDEVLDGVDSALSNQILDKIFDGLF